MSIKTILVHLANDDQHPVRLEVALKLARLHGAHIIALFLTHPAHMPAGAAGRSFSMSFLQESIDTARKAAEALRQEFDARCEEAGVTHDWLVEEHDHLDDMVRHAHCADLVIVSQSENRFLEDHVSHTVPETIAMSSGVPTLILPKVFNPAEVIGKNIVVAWRSTREAVRAVRNALPILKLAEKVTVLSVCRKEDIETHPEEIAAYLKRHGIDGFGLLDERSDRDAGEVIMEYVENNKADLIVMGAYSRSKVKELLFGGATRHVFSHSDVPILTAH